MATEKLLKVMLSGPRTMVDSAIRTLAMNGDFHPLKTSEILGSMDGLRAFDEPNPYADPLSSYLSLMNRLGIKPAFRDYADRDFDAESCTQFVEQQSGTAARLLTRKTAEDALIAENQQKIKAFGDYSALETDISGLLSARWCIVRFGHAEAASLPALETLDHRSEGLFLFRTGGDELLTRCICLMLPDVADAMTEELQARGFVFDKAPDPAAVSGVPKAQIAALCAEIDEATRKSKALADGLATLSREVSEELLARYSWLLFMSRAFEARTYAAWKGKRFFLEGWIPEESGSAFEEAAASLGLDCTLDKPGPADIKSAPSKFKTGFFTSIFAPFVSMYGFPAYGECDPRIFMTITYALLFGIMFGDIGQGAVLVLAGILLYKKKGAWLGRIMATVGVSSVIFGCIYGSVFGNEHWLPGFKVMEGGNMMTMLIVSVIVGVALIITCGILNIITGLRQKDYKKALFSANGVAGLVFFIGLVAGLAGKLLLKLDLFGSVPYLVFVLIVPILCLFCGEMLGKLCARRRDWLPESWGMFFIEGFFDIFEDCLSWFANCVSFLRVGAYAIAHAGMMTVVYMLSTTSSGGTAVWGVVLGNILVMVIEAVLVCIQVLRLEFYEMFGRFYSGSGHPFTPVTVDYAHPTHK